MFMTRVIVFGASITAGAWDKEGGWAQRLKNFLNERTISNISDMDSWYFTYNLAVSGDTTEDLLERFEVETKQRLRGDEETIFIFGIGINDSQFVHSQNDLRTPPEKFRENIQKLIDLAQKFASKIIFVGFTPVDESKTTPIPWNTEFSYKNENVKKYDGIVKSVCKENNVYFVEIFNQVTKLNHKKLLEDGLHPNSEGHQRIFEIVKEFLIKNTII